ncbi:methylated-DNA--[protein]-cysteine S-methyltransferase [Parachlamydia acanthamoebae]|uniref:methylated-DNA--[protein]-cysteine S-methyltransferase n=1 Tax=Parachlamydia acanthamoebae (strain UV7) TaxID=765952 RepID=F8KZ01_PARAV|nr:MGMT family protein [Parachlamydia acanthamoebae]EFB40923.1 hypothetical protein pah_c178o025 [Parachlamydia acanthamoebae str. Hall's coccus]CCB86124.1 methylated-DNA--protein-cysteine methyltransferase [Parachlamydia acanthamoebae UV-7]
MKMPLFETTKKSHGPAIGVHFELVENRIHHIYMTLGNGEGLEWYLYGDSARNKQVQKQIHAWMKNYLDRLPGTLPALYFSPKISAFHRKVWEYLTTLSIGQLASYGDVAEAVGSKGAARAVGTACARNNFPLLIPCHRVIASKAALGGFSCGLEIKRRLLEFEKCWHHIRNYKIESRTEAS